MANIDGELDDLYSQLSALSRPAASDIKEKKGSVERSTTRARSRSSSVNRSPKTISKLANSVLPPITSSPFNAEKIENVKTLLVNEFKNRAVAENNRVIDSKADLKAWSDKQSKLQQYIRELEVLKQSVNTADFVKDRSEEKTVQNGRTLQKLSFKEETSFDIIDNSETAVTILNRDELISNKQLFANGKKRKAGDLLADRDNSTYINTSAKLLKDNNTFGPLKLKKYSSR